MEILWQGKRLRYAEVTELDKREMEKVKAEDEFLNLRANITELEEKKERKKYTPSANHPWKRGWRGKDVPFSHSNKM